MIITILAAILAMFTPANSQGSRNVIVFLAPIGSTYGYVSIGVCMCDECCHAEAVKEYADEFTALFNSYEVKRAKNGALMIRQGNSGSYRFAKKGN